VISWQIPYVSRIIKVFIHVFLRIVITVPVSVEHSLTWLAIQIIVANLAALNVWPLLSSKEIWINLLIEIDSIILLLLTAIYLLLGLLSSSQV
jgi:hypothetical protein